MLLTMGIDPSMCATGLAFIRWEDNATQPQVETVRLATITSKPSDKVKPWERVAKIIDGIRRQVDLHCGTVDLRCGTELPDMVCIEAPFVHTKRVCTDLIALGHNIRHALWDHRIPFASPAATQVKRFAFGKGDASKGMIAKQVLKLWGIDAQDDNQADAAVLAMMAGGLLTAAKTDGPGWMNAIQFDTLKRVNVDGRWNA